VDRMLDRCDNQLRHRPDVIDCHSYDITTIMMIVLYKYLSFLVHPLTIRTPSIACGDVSQYSDQMCDSSQ
jgi:hypothetical protein